MTLISFPRMREKEKEETLVSNILAFWKKGTGLNLPHGRRRPGP